MNATNEGEGREQMRISKEPKSKQVTIENVCAFTTLERMDHTSKSGIGTNDDTHVRQLLSHH